MVENQDGQSILQAPPGNTVIVNTLNGSCITMETRAIVFSASNRSKFQLEDFHGCIITTMGISYTKGDSKGKLVRSSDLGILHSFGDDRHWVVEWSNRTLGRCIVNSDQAKS